MGRIDQQPQPQPGLKELTGFAQKHWRIGAATFAGIALLSAIKYSDIFIPQKSNPISTIPPPQIDIGTMPSQSIQLQSEQQPVKEEALNKDMNRYRLPVEPNEETVVKREELKPIEEVPRSAGIDKYGLITEKNFNQHFARVGKEEFKKLIEENPNKIVFPINPLSDRFSFGEYESTTLTDDSKNRNPYFTLAIYVEKAAIIAPVDGYVNVLTDGTGKPISVLVFNRLSPIESTTHKIASSGKNPKFINYLPPTTKIAKGDTFAHFEGSEPTIIGDNNVRENHLYIYMYYAKKLPQPIGVKTHEMTYLTPSLSNHDKRWLRSSDGRIAIPKIELPGQKPLNAPNQQSK